jgi:hypothetical protein
MKSQSKECLTIRSALAVVSAHPSEEEHDVLRTGLRVGPAGSEWLCSRKPWRSEQQWEDTLALRGKLVQESKTGEITTISEFFLQNHVSPSGLLTTQNPKMHGSDFSLKLNPLQNYGIMNLQNHGLSDSAVYCNSGINVNSILSVEKGRKICL